MPGPTHIGVYYRRGSSTLAQGEHEFAFHVGDAQHFQRQPTVRAGFARGAPLVRVVRIPARFRAELEAKAERFKDDSHLGHILYHARGPSANSTLYFPKEAVGPKAARGLGYHLEALAVHHLGKEGIRFITQEPVYSRFRAGQLRKAGLTPEQQYFLRVWLRGLGRGLRTPPGKGLLGWVRRLRRRA
jgi:hypothetical protein